VKKTMSFAVLMLLVLIGASTASFATTCTATTLTAGTGVWGAEAYGYDYATNKLDNILLKLTFASGGTFTGTEWQSIAGAFTGPTTVSGTWAVVSPVGDCQASFQITSPSTQSFNISINNAGKGATLAQTDTGYTKAGFMVAQGTIPTGSCTTATFKNKQFSLYSYGTIPAVGGIVSATGEIKFNTTGTTFASAPTVTLDLGGAGDFTVPATGTASLNTDCTGSGVLTVASLAQSFDVDIVVVDGGVEALWIVTNSGDNVSGYFFQ
jgi:hypothetical protein